MLAIVQWTVVGSDGMPSAGSSSSDHPKVGASGTRAAAAACARDKAALAVAAYRRITMPCAERHKAHLTPERPEASS